MRNLLFIYFVIVFVQYTIVNASLPKNQIDTIRSCLQNQYISLIGDSLMRYQYLNLAHYLATGNWVSSKPSMVWEREWDSWKDFYFGSTLRLSLMESCDCYRFGGTQDRRSTDYISTLRENRFFHLSSHNITISMHFMMGSHKFHVGRERPSMQMFANRRMHPEITMQEYKNYGANYTHEYTVNELISNEIAPYSPDIIIFNQGFWPYPRDAVTISKLANSLHQASKRVVWKTTSPELGVNVGNDTPDFLKLITENKFEIFDVYTLVKSKTFSKPPYFDSAHFTNNAYTIINLDMLRSIFNCSV